MVSLARIKDPSGTYWRLRWREGGRGSKARSRRFTDKQQAMAERDEIRARLNADKSAGNRVLIPWAELRINWLKQHSGRHEEEAKRALERYTKAWSSTKSATPSAMSVLPLATCKIVRSVLRWARLHHNQPVDERALGIPGKRIRPKKAKPPLLTDDRIAELMNAADETGPGNGGIVHLIATYGHRAENLIALTAGHFKNGRAKFRVKGGWEVDHPLLESTRQRIDELIEEHPKGPLFLNHLGEVWESGKEFASWFFHSFGIGYYQLKRAAISRWLARGIDAKTIASITGHKTVSLLLDTYAATNEHRQAAAIAALHEPDEKLPAMCVQVCPEEIPRRHASP